MNTNKCAVQDTGKIYYNIDTIDVKTDPTKTPATAFEAAFLGDVIEEITGECFRIQENCKSMYPDINNQNYRDWITSVDQDNRIALAHVLELSKVPILYNTPRLCDPGMTMSKNWSLRNYIETRLFAFKFKYNMGRDIQPRNRNNCYPSMYFDFRPFEYKLELPSPKNTKPNPLYVTEWITVERGDASDLGYTPHMRISNRPFGTQSDLTTKAIFRKMVKDIITVRLGSSNSSIIHSSINIGPNSNSNGQVSNSNITSYITDFINFITEYDGIVFDISPVTGQQTVRLTDKAISVLYYDLIHDSVFTKSGYDLAKFKANFKKQFYVMSQAPNLMEERVDYLVGAGTARQSHATYGKTKASILIRVYKGELVKSAKTKRSIKHVPSIFKTLGDLSQYIYASTYNTVVASGDKMGLATGLFMCAMNGRKLKLMMEDSVTGFILYTGFNRINFVSKTSCISQRSGACSRNNVIRNKSNIADRIRSSVPNSKKDTLNMIMKSKPVRPRLDINLRTFTNSSAPLNKNAAQEFFNKVNKFLPHFTEDELGKVERILDSIEKRITPSNKNIVNRNLRVLRRGIRIAKTGENQNKQNIGQKRPRNNQLTPNNQKPNNRRTPNKPSNGQNNQGTPNKSPNANGIFGRLRQRMRT